MANKWSIDSAKTFPFMEPSVDFLMFIYMKPVDSLVGRQAGMSLTLFGRLADKLASVPIPCPARQVTLATTPFISK